MNINGRTLKDIDEEINFVRNETVLVDAEIKALRSALGTVKDRLSSLGLSDIRSAIASVSEGIYTLIDDALDHKEILNDLRWKLIHERIAILHSEYAKGKG